MRCIAGAAVRLRGSADLRLLECALGGDGPREQRSRDGVWALDDSHCTAEVSTFSRTHPPALPATRPQARGAASNLEYTLRENQGRHGGLPSFSQTKEGMAAAAPGERGGSIGAALTRGGAGAQRCTIEEVQLLCVALWHRTVTELSGLIPPPVLSGRVSSLPPC